MASKDIHPILDGWSYTPNRITARKIVGRDSTIKIQMRVELGVLQMEPVGRPDGHRPEGCESYLDYHEQRLEKYKDRNGTNLGFFLAPDECRALREEAALYYQRYLALFVLEDFDGVARDTDRNLRVLDLCKAYAMEERDRLMLEQFRPYLVMMNTRAFVQQALADNKTDLAKTRIDASLARIHAFFEEVGPQDGFERSHEAQILRQLREKIVKLLPADPKDKLRRELDKALRAERYEDAAALRDKIEHLTMQQPSEHALREKRG